MSRNEKERSHGRIVASASRLLRERGLEGASVVEIMKDSGLTHGGFYKHFDSKEALVEAGLERAFAEFLHGLEGEETEQAVATFRALYLSRGHLAEPGRGCPVAALGAEIARGPTALKGVFGAGVRRMVDALGRVRDGSAAARRTAALRDFSMLVGAMVIARASDAALADEVLAACGGEARHVA